MHRLTWPAINICSRHQPQCSASAAVTLLSGHNNSKKRSYLVVTNLPRLEVEITLSHPLVIAPLAASGERSVGLHPTCSWEANFARLNGSKKKHGKDASKKRFRPPTQGQWMKAPLFALWQVWQPFVKREHEGAMLAPLLDWHTGCATSLITSHSHIVCCCVHLLKAPKLQLSMWVRFHFTLPCGCTWQRCRAALCYIALRSVTAL